MFMRRLLPIRLFPLCCFALLLLLARDLSGLTVLDGPHVQCAESSASIVWKTDVEAGTRVQYGTRENMLDQRASAGVGTHHQVDLTGLQPGTRYFFSIGSARKQLGTGSFQTLGKSAAAPPSGPSIGSTVKRFLTGLISNDQQAPAQAKAKPPVSTAPATRETWCHLDTLEDHYLRHGSDFQSTSSADYAAQAWHFLQRARRDALPMKWDEADNTLRVWDPQTRTFAAYDARGKTRTFFKPSNPGYWNRQPGQPVKPDALPFRR